MLRLQQSLTSEVTFPVFPTLQEATVDFTAALAVSNLNQTANVAACVIRYLASVVVVVNARDRLIRVAMATDVIHDQ